MSRPWIIAGSVFALLVLVSAAGGYALLRYHMFYLPSESMQPTIPMGQSFIVDRFAYRSGPPQRGDVVVFTPPIPSKSAFVKRIVAVPGDRFAIRGGLALLNGRRLDEPYVKEKTDYDVAIRDYGIVRDGKPLDPSQAFIPPRRDWDSPETVPRGCYFVLGDNRNNSEDSHVFGFLCPGRPGPQAPKQPVEIIGRAVLR